MMSIFISGITCFDTNKIMLILPNLYTNVFWLKRLQLTTHFDPFTKYIENKKANLHMFTQYLSGLIYFIVYANKDIRIFD